jgi:translation initiation factor 2 subunit 1
MILLSELSRRRIRSINNLIRVGRTEIVVVLRVDEEKGYIDLSKRRVDATDIAKCEEKYAKSRAVHSILRNVSEKTGFPLLHLYEQFGWDLHKRYEHAYTAFQLMVSNADEVLAPYESVIDPSVRKCLVDNVKLRLTPQALKFRADLEVTCFAYAGINAIKKALLSGKACETKEMPIAIKLVAPPLYVLMTNALKAEDGVGILNKAVQAITQSIKADGGEITVKSAPRAVSERDDRLLSILIETLEKKKNAAANDEED